MDHIRKALERARLEKASSAEDVGPGVAVAPQITGRPERSSQAARAATAPPARIVYTRTRVFTPSAQLLESNRIMNPASADPAAAAFRMLRTQVLQRMNAHDWRSLAIFSASPNDGKTTTAINLALSLASDQHHTALLVDFDFKRPSLGACIGLSPESGGDDGKCADRGLPLSPGRLRPAGGAACARPAAAILGNPRWPALSRVDCGTARTISGALHRV